MTTCICTGETIFTCMSCFVVLCLGRHLRRLPESEVEEENKPLKLPGALATMTGTVMYPDEESAKWDVDGIPFKHKSDKHTCTVKPCLVS